MYGATLGSHRYNFSNLATLLAKAIRSKCHRHVPAPAGWLEAGHLPERVLGDDDMLYEGPRCPGRRGKVIKAVLKLGSLRHDGVGSILHGGLQLVCGF